VAVHEPDTWVRGVERNNEETSLSFSWIGWHNCNITAWRVVKVKRGAVTVCTKTLREDQEVVAVKMDRVRKRDRRLDDHVHPLTEVGNLDGKVAGSVWNSTVVEDALESRVLPLSVERGAGKSPFEEVGVAALRRDDDTLFDGRAL
jgi:hypothetical protein